MTVTAAAPPADDSDALNMFLASLRYLTAADHTAMPAGQQARCLQVLEEGQSMATVARALILGAFTAGETSDAVKLSSCLGKFFRGGGEGDGLLVVLPGDQAVPEAAEQAAEQVALGGGVPVAGVFAPVVVGAGAG